MRCRLAYDADRRPCGAISRSVTDTATLVADLNTPQREAVEAGDGPLLIVAGAGSGKTRVITRRIAHLIARGVPARSILAITFTRKAAGEMRERVEQLVGEAGVTLSTFHGFCARVLRRDGEAVGLRPGFTIYDRDDQLALVRQIGKDFGFDPQNPHPRALIGAISRLKNDGLLPDEADVAGLTPFDRMVARVYQRYTDELDAANAADFDDLLLKTVTLLRDHPRARERYQRTYQHVLVDEYQDTNRIQDWIARTIAEGHGNLCVTGDPDQSIYRWRGARIRNILEFEQDFPGATVVRLEQNYRSTNHILRAASTVVSHNPGRLMGDLWSELGDGEPVVLLSTDDEEAEADRIVRMVRERHEQGTALADMAVFYRTNALSRAFERALRLHNVAYDLIGSVEFYERKEVKDLMAYLRVLSNPSDALAFLRVVNVPARGIGKTTLDRLRAWAAPLGIGPCEAARRAAEAPDLTKRARKALAGFVALLDGLATTLDGPVEATLSAVIERTGFLDHLRDYGGQEAAERMDNVTELQNAVAEYSRNETRPTITGFLEETVLLTSLDRTTADVDRLTLMTLHSAKGLEFDYVYMAGMEEGLLPHQRSLDTEEEIQEERRLCYVGMTRARRGLVLSHAARRAMMGAWMPTVPSRFLAELPTEEVVAQDHVSFFRPSSAGRRPGGQSPLWGGSGGSPGGGRARPAEPAPEYVPDASDYVDVPTGEQALPVKGQAVRHPHFGQGVVLAVSGTGARARITVRFERFGEKQLMAEYARLEPVF